MALIFLNFFLWISTSFIVQLWKLAQSAQTRVNPRSFVSPPQAACSCFGEITNRITLDRFEG